MKGKLKKLVATFVATVMAFTAMPFAVNAEENIGESKVFNFDVKSCGWEESAAKGVYCHIWRFDGTGNYPGWQSKAEKCTYDESTGIATYDIAVGIKKGYTDLETIGKNNEWRIIFSTGDGNETYPAVLNSHCFGDTLYAPDSNIYYEDPVDSDKKSVSVKWQKTGIGASLNITSTGKVQGEALPYGETKETILAKYLVSHYNDNENLSYTLDIMDELNVNADDVIDTICWYVEQNADFYIIPIEEIIKKLSDIVSGLSDITIPLEEKVFYIDVNSLGWKFDKDEKFYCHLYNINLDYDIDTPEFASKAQECTYDASTGIATYSIKTAVDKGYDEMQWISDKNEWLLIFYSKSGHITYEVFVTSDCYGDTLYAIDPEYSVPAELSGPTDSEFNYNYVILEWKNSIVGAPLYITTEGDIYGWDIPYGETYESMLAEMMFVYCLVGTGFEEDPDTLQNIIDELYVKPADVVTEIEIFGEELEKLGYQDLSEIVAKLSEALNNCEDPTKYVIGDIDGDGELKIQDVTMLQRYLAEVIELDDTQLSNADADFNDNVNVQDVTTMQR
ncbi:MAG: dockerin type I repeat-containing protein, partial [Ruminococcus sp.]|nr:dockerin type I repeat-containing protein [Ruminococcus sp.]